MSGLPVDTLNIRRRAGTSGRRRAHARIRDAWPFDPVQVLRVALVATYVIEAWIAVNAFRAGAPSFEVLRMPAWFTPVWACLLIAATLTAAAGSIADRFALVEQWASLVVASLALAYVIAVNWVAYGSDPIRQMAAAMSILMVVLPGARFGYFLVHVGKVPAEPTA